MLGAVNLQTCGAKAIGGQQPMDTHETQQRPIDQSTAGDSDAQLVMAKAGADTIPNAERPRETTQFPALKDARPLRLEKLRVPGESMSEKALTEVVVADLTGTTFIEAKRLVTKALDALTDEGLLARVASLVVLRPDAPPIGRQGQPSYHGIRPDAV